MFRLCTNKNHSYKHNEQISSQYIDNAECVGHDSGTRKKNILVSGRPEQKCPVNAILLLK
jgi:ferredoxin